MSAPSDKRPRVDPPAPSRGVSVSAAARISQRCAQNVSSLLGQSQTISAAKQREAKAHKRLWQDLGVQRVDLKCSDGTPLRWSEICKHIAWVHAVGTRTLPFTGEGAPLKGKVHAGVPTGRGGPMPGVRLFLRSLSGGRFRIWVTSSNGITRTIQSSGMHS